MTSPVPDEVPVEDAIEQSRDATETVPDREVPEPDEGGPPLEASTADWQEQVTAAAPGGDEEDLDRRRLTRWEPTTPVTSRVCIRLGLGTPRPCWFVESPAHCCQPPSSDRELKPSAM
ncbi:MAG: hypothetical protein U5N53_32060 [Mycobacterium sp.]|nr:hypothetical protein [Mycobacterium sp.]